MIQTDWESEVIILNIVKIFPSFIIKLLSAGFQMFYAFRSFKFVNQNNKYVNKNSYLIVFQLN